MLDTLVFRRSVAGLEGVEISPTEALQTDEIGATLYYYLCVWDDSKQNIYSAY